MNPGIPIVSALLFVIKLNFVTTFVLESQKYPIVRLKQGVIRGFIWKTESDDIFAFQGIPYATPPTGDLRFKPPKPVEPWIGILNATYEGRMCPQNSIIPFEVMGDEDCLFLNVYVPKSSVLSSSLLPVVVFIHGGSFQYISGSSLYFGPKKLMKYNIILVTFNYRLGPLGFLSTDDEICPGNFGLLDQILALKWIQENIEYFGGNKNEVTVMGQSSGAMSITAHLVAPLSKGLFHRAILESGTIFAPNMFTRNPLLQAQQLAELVNCPIHSNQELISCLKTKSASELTDVGNSMKLENKELIVPQFVPVVDRVLVSDLPENLYKDGKFHQMPILSGINENEVMALYFADLLQRNMLTKEVKFWLKYKFSIANSFASSTEEARIILEKVEKEIIDENDYMNITSFRLKLTKFLTVGFYLAPEIRFLKYVWKRNPSYVYVFGYRGKLGLLDAARTFHDNYTVTHSDELPYLFSGFLDLLKRKEDSKFNDIFLQLFTNFIKYGNTSLNNHPVSWNPVTSDDIEYLWIGRNITMSSKFQEKFVQFFNEILRERLAEITENKSKN